MILESCKRYYRNNERTEKYEDEQNTFWKIIRVNGIEENGDIISRTAIKQIFRSNMEVIDIIKWREIYQYLEDTLDSCEDLANVVEGVVMKNA